MNITTVPLFAKVAGQGPPLLVLHGVFGSGDNWATFVKPWLEQRTVHLLDLRNHGKSPHAPDTSYAALAADVAAYIQNLELGPVAVLGHSMGGKTTLQLAATYPSLVSRAAIVDIAPRGYRPHHQAYLDGYRALDVATLQSRAQAEERMAAFVPDASLRQFLLKNLGRNADGTFALRLNLEAVASGIENVGAALPENANITCPLLCVGGAASNYIRPEDEADIKRRFPQAQVRMIAGAGHWIHVDQPAALAQALQAFFGIVM